MVVNDAHSLFELLDQFDPYNKQHFEILEGLVKKYPNFHERLIALNFWRVGTPYGIFCLGEEKGFDKDPIIRIDTSDCTVHVLTSMAFAKGKSFDEARDAMISLHYKPDEILMPKQ